MSDFVRMSLETHLFFCRIMKEHSLFLMAGFPGKNKEYIDKADWYREQFEDLLRDVVEASDGMVGRDVLESGEVTTEYTKKAEKCTSCLTGISIDSAITERSARISPLNNCQQRQNQFAGRHTGQYTGQRMYDNRGQWQQNRQNSYRMRSNQYGTVQRNQYNQTRVADTREEHMNQKVRAMNDKALELVRGLICFKEDILREVRNCNLYTANYPLLIEHILREAKLYRDTVVELNENGDISMKDQRAMEQFWNQIMMEHALFIRGLLDPSEEELVRTAHGFAGDYRRLLEEARDRDMRTMDDLTRRTIRKTEEYQNFKAAGTRGLSNCEIDSIILPLLADHVLREANHYLRLLNEEG